jgi:streptogramin lyase
VDAKDHVWVFTRAKPPVQVYDADGKFIRGWGDDIIQTAHYIRLDRQGNVWVADLGKHAVLQFTPEGKLLKTLGNLAIIENQCGLRSQFTGGRVVPHQDV